ncbi:hypothetical protein Selin_0479 [Desulfurispirillum indicum S5]|uniref:Uncharacterized protein n=1 Tax=Desulfurispirillum indicum (strain ATCC BAA-1389 / DSM 22839 / S5) TaxID=653733 RepID=E6W0H8_DESIS|nr:hypothetical protein [Desulfurispirillum indicum]ADU65230.1 hypothetical protein Selin_0479 [Desulfurispirillum indicum S5]
MSTQTNPRHIILENSHNASKFNDEEFIHLEAYNQTEKLISDIIGNATDIFETERGHYSISIFGGRGSGKTTFALTTMKKLSEKTIQKDTKFKLCSLDMLDPTLMDTKEHVLLSLISLIRAKVQRHYSCYQSPIFDDGECDILRESKLPDGRDEWSNSLKCLAEGLKQLDGIGSDVLKQEIWDDSITIMEEGLNNAYAGLMLNKRFHNFIKHSAKALDVDAFVIALDDVDTFFDKGWSVLETLRKFITTPRLITLVCGDIQLYATQVRKHQWMQLGELPTKYEKERPFADYRELVQALEEQYLLKLLKAPYRIWLPTLAQLNTDNIYVYKNMKEKELQVSEPHRTMANWLSRFITNQCGIITEAENMPTMEDAPAYLSFITSLPLRLVLQLLQSTNESGDKDPFSLDLSVLGDIFASWIFSSNLHKGLSNFQDQTLAIARIHEAMYSSNLLFKDLELVPRYTNQEENIAAFVLSILSYARFRQNKASQLDYMITGGLLREALTQANDEIDSNKILSSLNTFSEQDTLAHSRRWISVMRSFPKNNPPLRHGSLQVLTDGQIIKKRKLVATPNLFRTRSTTIIKHSDFHTNPAISSYILLKSESKDALKNWFAQKRYTFTPKEIQWLLQNSIAKDIIGIPFIIGLGHKDESPYFASIMNVISALAVFTSSDHNLNSKETGEDRLTGLFNRAGHIRTYPMLKTIDIAKDKIDGDDHDDVDNAPSSKYITTLNLHGEDAIRDHNRKNETFIRHFMQWIKAFQEAEPLPAAVWSRIWQRFYYTLTQQSDDFTTNDLYIGRLLHRQLIAFLNAVLVEMARFYPTVKHKNESIRLQNPTNSDYNFLHNLKAWSEWKKSNVFALLFTCPLWGYYFENKDEINDSIPEDNSFNTGVFSKYIERTNELFENAIDKELFCVIPGVVGVSSLLNLIPPVRTTGKPSVISNQRLENLLKDTTFKKELKALFDSDYKPEGKAGFDAFVESLISKPGTALRSKIATAVGFRASVQSKAPAKTKKPTDIESQGG